MSILSLKYILHFLKPFSQWPTMSELPSTNCKPKNSRQKGSHRMASIEICSWRVHKIHCLAGSSKKAAAVARRSRRSQSQSQNHWQLIVADSLRSNRVYYGR